MKNQKNLCDYTLRTINHCSQGINCTHKKYNSILPVPVSNNYKKKILILFVFIPVFYFAETVFAIDTAAVKYFPMHTGNIYTYYAWNWPYPNNGGCFKARISKDTIMNGHKYFYLLNFPDIQPGWVRFDSVRTNLLYYFPGAYCSNYTNEKIIDSLGAKPNNQIIYCAFPAISTQCEDTTSTTLFNTTPVKAKKYRHDGLHLAHLRYAKDFGIIAYDMGEPPPSTYFVYLKGCVINGVLYGDTLLTNVKHISSEVPSSYSLYQNFPNPFNPTTNIQFSIIKVQNVTLKIYDLLGREAATLVNERLAPGTYSVNWNASQYPSGVYFYRLQTERYSDVKKMILIK